MAEVTPINESAPVVPVTPASAEPKSGVKTTEFWLSLAGQLAPLFATAIPDELRAILATVAAGLYTISRGLAKRPAVQPPVS